MFWLPWNARSASPSGLSICNVMVARFGKPVFCGLNLIAITLLALQGVWQLPRAAKLLICSARQRRADDVPLASSERIAFEAIGSRIEDGSKMKARSFAKPSPFTSPAIIGV